MKVNLNLPVEIQCVKCKTNHIINVNSKDYIMWLNGALIQAVMPYLETRHRELLISKVCEPCFDAMFPPYEDENEEELPCNQK